MEIKINKKSVKEEKIPFNLNLENKEKLQIKGVMELFMSSETEVKAKTSMGNLKIVGQNLKPEKLNLETKELEVTGEIDGVMFYGSGAKKSFLKRIFK